MCWPSIIPKVDSKSDCMHFHAILRLLEPTENVSAQYKSQSANYIVKCSRILIIFTNLSKNYTQFIPKVEFMQIVHETDATILCALRFCIHMLRCIAATEMSFGKPNYYIRAKWFEWGIFCSIQINTDISVLIRVYVRPTWNATEVERFNLY